MLRRGPAHARGARAGGPARRRRRAVPCARVALAAVALLFAAPLAFATALAGARGLAGGARRRAPGRRAGRGGSPPRPAALLEGSAVQIRWEDGQWRDATVERTLEGGGIRVRFELDGYEYHWLPDVWRISSGAAAAARALPEEPLPEESSSDEPRTPPGGAAAGGTAEAPPAAAPRDGAAQPPAARVEAPPGEAAAGGTAEDDEAQQPVTRREHLRRGQRLRATVIGVKPFGAFVAHGDIRGIVHVSCMMTEGRTKSVADIVQEGQEVDVWVRSVNPTVEFSMVDVWSFAEVDSSTWISGRVVALASPGIYVAVRHPDGGAEFEGLLAESIDELTARGVTCSVGQVLDVRIISVDVDKVQVRLSTSPKVDMSWLRDVPDSAWLNATVTKIFSSSLLVNLRRPGFNVDSGVRGIVPANLMTGAAAGSLADEFSLGQTVRVRVVDVRAETEEATVSMLAYGAEADSLMLFEKAMADGLWLNATVKATMAFGIFVDVRAPGASPDSPAYGGLIHISEIGGFVRNVGDVAEVGESLMARIISVDREQRKLSLTMKADVDLWPWMQLGKDEWITAVVKQVDEHGLSVEARLPGDETGTAYSGFVEAGQIRRGYVATAQGEAEVGDEVPVRVLRLNQRDGTVTFSMRPAVDISAFRNASKDDRHPAVVLGVNPKGVYLVVRPPVQPGEPWEGIVPPAQGADYRLGQQVSVRVLHANEKQGKLRLQWA